MQNSILLSDITGGIAVMEAATMADNMGVRRLRSNVFRIENEGFPTIQEQAVEAKGILKSLAPIINNLRLFGLYFTYKEPADCEIATDQSQQLARRCSRWSFSRIHATVILVVMWLNTACLHLRWTGNVRSPSVRETGHNCRGYTEHRVSDGILCC